MDISVIIVSYNTKDLLNTCLKSIFKFSKNNNFEIIVVDNNSEDGSQQMIRNDFADVKLIENNQNFGFAKANNQGIKIAKGQYIFLLNSDTYFIEDSLTKLLEKAKSKNFDLVGPLLLNDNKTIQQSAGYSPNLLKVLFWISFIDDLPYGYLLKPFHVDNDSFYSGDKEIDWITGAAFFITKKVIDKIGAFDEKIFMYTEEVEWCYRIKKAGFKIFFSDCTKIVHIGRGSSAKIPTKAFIGEYEGLKYFYSKHKNTVSLHVLSVLLKIGALARIIVFGLLGRKQLARAYVEALKVA